MSLTFLNIYESAITNARDTSRDLLREAETLLDAFELHIDSAPFWLMDIDHAALSRLEETINVHDLTNSIIGAYFSSAIDAIMQNPFFEENRISFSYDANCHASSIMIYLNHHGQEYHDGTLTEIVKEAFLNQVLDDFLSLVEDYFTEIGVEYERKWFEEDLLSLGLTDFVEKIEEISVCIEAGNLSEEMKTHLSGDGFSL